jgi:hypothetical protein
VSDFRPGVDRMRAAGYTVEAQAYPPGDQGIALSLDEVARKIRDGRLDADVRGWAGDVLIAAGKPTALRTQAQAMLDAFRAQTMYLSDPVAAEYIVGAAATACLRPGLCVRARDCDDGVVFLGSAMMSIGIPVRVLKQSFGPDAPQEHVLLEARDEHGIWFSVDPSTDLPVGQRVPAVTEVRIDPMQIVGSLGTQGQEIVTLGALAGLGRVSQGTVYWDAGTAHYWVQTPAGPMFHDQGRWRAWDGRSLGAVARRDVHHDGRVWRERRYGREYVYENCSWREVSSTGGGLAGFVQRQVDGHYEEWRDGRWTPVGLGDAPTVPWQSVSDRSVTAGLRYKLDFLVSALGTADARTVDYVDARSHGQAADYLTKLLSAQWLIESLLRTNAAAGGVDSWQLIGIAKIGGTMVDDAFFSLTAESVQASSAPASNVTPPAVPKPAPPSGTVSAPAIVFGALGAAAAGGLAWGLWRRYRRAA